MFQRRSSASQQASAAMSRPKITFGTRAVVCQEAELKGEINIGSGSVLHPQCKVLAENGPIIIGTDNIIEENVVIVNKNTKPLIIGDGNVFEVGCYIEGSKIGDCNIVEAKARILNTTSIGDNCVIGTGCSTEIHETVPDNTVIYGYNHNRRVQGTINTAHRALHARHLDYLREVLPKYNHLKTV